MKTFKVYLKDYVTESVTAENYAVDDQNNLVVGNNMFHKDHWTRIIFSFEDTVGSYGQVDLYAGLTTAPTTDYIY